jgi:uncharacterized BrkB/YihY/UPF0761 family membrane protein
MMGLIFFLFNIMAAMLLGALLYAQIEDKDGSHESTGDAPVP